MGERKVLETLKLGLIFCAGGFIAVAANELRQPVRTCTEIRQDLSPYVQCMGRAGELHCSMQVEDFRKYHALKREHARQCMD